MLLKQPLSSSGLNFRTQRTLRNSNCRKEKPFIASNSHYNKYKIRKNYMKIVGLLGM